MNTKKIEYVEMIKGYKLNKNQVGCKWWKICATCPYSDCIKDKKFIEPPKPKKGDNKDD